MAMGELCESTPIESSCPSRLFGSRPGVGAGFLPYCQSLKVDGAELAHPRGFEAGSPIVRHCEPDYGGCTAVNWPLALLRVEEYEFRRMADRKFIKNGLCFRIQG
jgi:hypothetical protein